MAERHGREDAAQLIRDAGHGDVRPDESDPDSSATPASARAARAGARNDRPVWRRRSRADTGTTAPGTAACARSRAVRSRGRRRIVNGSCQVLDRTRRIRSLNLSEHGALAGRNPCSKFSMGKRLRL
jgi:hypothetical protein